MTDKQKKIAEIVAKFDEVSESFDKTAEEIISVL